MTIFFPPLALSPPFALSPSALLRADQITQISLWAAFALLVFDWISYLPLEYSAVWCASTSVDARCSFVGWRDEDAPWWRRAMQPGRGSMRAWFLASRYSALLQAVYVLVVTQAGRSSVSVCEAGRGLSFGFTVAGLCTQVVLILRVYGVCGHSSRVLRWLALGGALDVAAQLAVDGAIQPLYLTLPTTPATHSCFLTPSSALFALTFIAPSLLSHLILFLTLYTSWAHLEVERVVGTGVIRLLRRDQLSYVLAICLVNALNIVLVLQRNHKQYRLILYLPALCITQALLTRLYFSLMLSQDKRGNCALPIQLPPGLSTTRVEEGTRESSVKKRLKMRDMAVGASRRHGGNTDSWTLGRTTLEIVVPRESGESIRRRSSVSISVEGSNPIGVDLGPASKTSYETGGGQPSQAHTPSVTGSSISTLTAAGRTRADRHELAQFNLRNWSQYSSSLNSSGLSPSADSTESGAQSSPPPRPDAPTPNQSMPTHAEEDEVPIAQRLGARPPNERARSLPEPIPIASSSLVGARFGEMELAPSPSIYPSESAGSSDESAPPPPPPLPLPTEAPPPPTSFSPPRRVAVGGPRPAFDPITPAQFKPERGGAAYMGVDDGINSAAWTAQMFG